MHIVQWLLTIGKNQDIAQNVRTIQIQELGLDGDYYGHFEEFRKSRNWDVLQRYYSDFDFTGKMGLRKFQTLVYQRYKIEIKYQQILTQRNPIF